MDIYFNDRKQKENQNQDKNEVESDEDQELNPNERKKDKLEKENLAEGHENEMNEKLDERDNKYTVYKNSIEFDMSTHKREVRMKKQDKIEMEKIRRWQVKISNIYITPLLKMIDPFLQFTIGGNFSVAVYKNKKGETYKIPSGKRGYSDKTEVLENVNIQQDDGQGGKTPFSKTIDIEMRMSYSQINKQKLMIELWEHNNIWMNEIHSYITIPLIDIANGNCNQSVYIMKKEPGKKKKNPFAIIDFNCIFQEIWDFNLYFLNWRATNILPPRKKKTPDTSNLPSTKIKIKFLDGLGDSMKKTSTSEIIEHSANPIWTKFDNKILFRGTTSELENNYVEISLIDTSSLFSTTLAKKEVGLKGLVEFETIKTEVNLKDKDTGENYPVNIQGFVTLDSKPRYRQQGQNVLLLSYKKYLVIKIMRVESIKPAETRGIVDSFISVEWAGMNQRTRTVKENNNPSFNELLYFPVPLPDSWLKNIDEHVLEINQELSSKNEVSFNLMIEGDDNTYDNFGIGYFYLSDIKNGGKKVQEKYFADDLKKDNLYLSEKFTSKVKLISAFSKSTNTFLHFEAWFLESFPPIVDFGEKKKKSEMRDKIPLELQKFFPASGKEDRFSKNFNQRIREIFKKYSNYSHKDRLFTNFRPQDQYTNVHLLPYYLCPITVPEKKYSRKDIESNPNFFDSNIKTLENVAHYVRCFTFPSDLRNDIWSSPDFMLKRRKGNVEEHAILMACLMMGLKKLDPNKKVFLTPDDVKGDSKKTKDLELITDNHRNNNTKTGSLIDNSKIKTSNEETLNEEDIKIDEKEIMVKDDEYFPYLNRVFVCQGKLKENKQNHCWVMVISDDYRDITFYDPKLEYNFHLAGRVKEPMKLRNFLNSLEDEKKDGDNNKNDKNDEKKKHMKNYMKDIDQIELKGEGDDSLVLYEKSDDFGDKNESQSELGRSIIDKRMIDEKLAFDPEENEEKFDFIENDKEIDKLNEGNEKNFLAQDSFKDSKGEFVKEVYLPYETIDLIFNQNNIFANCQFHMPEQIYYNIYDQTQWLPFFYLEKKDGQITKFWKGKFPQFYSLSNFSPCYSPGLVRKMTDSLIKEMRQGIDAARSGKNLPTRFKKKGEKINKQLSKYLDYLEYLSMGRMTQEEFEKKKKNWKIVCKKYMPKFYKMNAQCVKFNFYETEIIRREITEDLEDFWYTKIKNVVFATSARVYAYPNQTVCVRIMLAKFYKIPLEDIADKEEIKLYQEMEKEDPDKLIEEEVDSDEENDKKEKENENEKKIKKKEDDKDKKDKEKKDKNKKSKNNKETDGKKEDEKLDENEHSSIIL